MSRVHLPLAGADVSRRDFLGLAAAALAAAGLAGCERPHRKIVPYAVRPEGVVPGKPLHYATALPSFGFATGVVVTAREGRPIKVEGNPAHPASLGAAGPHEQASLVDLYHPGRARLARHDGRPVARRAPLEWIGEQGHELEARRGAGLRLLVEPGASPQLADLRGRILARFPEAKVYAYASAGQDAAYAGASIAFGQPLEARYDLGRARVVVSLDADLLGAMPMWLRNSRQLAPRRDPGPDMSRLYVVESAMTVTGMTADHRLRARSSDVESIALALLAHVASRQATTRRDGSTDSVPAALRSGDDHAARLVAALGAPSAPVDDAWLRAVSADLWASAGRSLVAAGPRQPPVVHAAAHLMNALLGNLGNAALLSAPALDDVEHGPSALSHLLEEVDAGAVDTLIVTARDPAYASPGELGFAARVAKVRNVVYSSLFEDETSRLSTWYVPAAHPLESWGDLRAQDGTVSVVQPLIAPLFGGLTAAELLAPLVDERGRDPHDMLVDSWTRRRGGADLEEFWDESLRRGVVDGSAAAPVDPKVAWDAATRELGRAAGRARTPGVELDVRTDYSLYDGRHAENAWLEELPDPVTKLTWDNAAYVSPAAAARLGVETGDVLALRIAGVTVKAPAFVAPGQHDESITVQLGYGRAPASGATPMVGFDAYPLVSAAAPWFRPGLSVEKTGERYSFAVTQDQSSMHGRPLALETTLSAFEKDRDQFAREREAVATLYDPYEYRSHKWGMAIDLGRCTGCSACVVACQIENNVQVVGKEQVLKGREMHWLRIDRYVEGPTDAPRVVTQPVMCVHCENAPCEYVCPVNATVHSDEGLNEMVYNRCVGTRYCSNNCPYKVRRFNFFDYQHEKTETERMMANPDVTLRSRGVMEKCTYCVQRIETARIEARIHGRAIADGDVVSACQQACPADAIVFGDLADPASRVSRLQGDERAYKLLNELGTRPRTSHLARVRNPNPEIA